MHKKLHLSYILSKLFVNVFLIYLSCKFWKYNKKQHNSMKKAKHEAIFLCMSTMTVAMYSQ